MAERTTAIREELLTLLMLCKHEPGNLDRLLSGMADYEVAFAGVPAGAFRKVCNAHVGQSIHFPTITELQLQLGVIAAAATPEGEALGKISDQLTKLIDLLQRQLTNGAGR